MKIQQPSETDDAVITGTQSELTELVNIIQDALALGVTVVRDFHDGDEQYTVMITPRNPAAGE